MPLRDRAGTPYFLRILPYRVFRNAEARAIESTPIDGVVLTLTNITSLDRARAGLAQLSAIVESSEDAIIGQGLDGSILSPATWRRAVTSLQERTVRR